MTDNALYTLTRKNVLGQDDWLVIRADSLEVLYAADQEASEHAEKFIENRGRYNASVMTNAPQQGATTVGQFSPSPASVTTVTPAGPRVEVDQWGNEWTHGLPYAPPCDRHSTPMARKKGMSRTGSSYEGWFCALKDKDCPPKFGK